jgi:hypothetical protein
MDGVDSMDTMGRFELSRSRRSPTRTRDRFYTLIRRLPVSPPLRIYLPDRRYRGVTSCSGAAYLFGWARIADCEPTLVRCSSLTLA